MPGDPGPAPDALGERFEVRGVLGRGGMGVVYRAFDRQLGREVAVKLMLGASAQRMRRLEREGQAVANLSHPGIVRLHGTGEHAGKPFLVCELIEGAQTLDAVFRERELKERVRLVRDAAHAVGAAHAAGVVHRDVKPENLLVDAEGRLLVTDFGLAMTQGEDRLTQTGATLGTPHYMSPEQVQGLREDQGPASDVWSLGVVLYLALTDALPFEGESFGSLGYAITHATPTSPRTLRPGLDPRLATICARALRKDPAQRFADARSLAAELDSYLSGEGRSSGPPRLLAGVALALGLALLGAAILRGDVAPPAAESEPEPPPAAPQPPEDDGATLARRWTQLSDPLTRYALGRRLVREHPDSAQAAAAATYVAQQRTAAALLATLPEAPQPGATWVWFEAGQLRSLQGNGALTTWDPATGVSLSHVALPYRLQNACPTGPGELLLNPVHEHPSLVFLKLGSEPHVLERVSIASASLATSPSWLLAGSSDGRVLLHPRDGSAAKSLLGLEYPPNVVAVSPDERRVAAAGQEVVAKQVESFSDSVLGVWDLESGELLAQVKLAYRVRVLNFSADGERLILGSSVGALDVRDAESGAPRFELTVGDAGLLRSRAHEGSVRDACELPGEWLLSASRASDRPDKTDKHQLKLWDLRAQALVRDLPHPSAPPTSIAFSEEHGLIAVGTSGGTVEVFALPELERDR